MKIGQIYYSNWTIITNHELVSMSILNMKIFGNLKKKFQLFELFDYLI
jgi:hypothetical protein